MWNPFKRTNKPNKQNQQGLTDVLEFMHSDPMDVVFTKNFNKGGGHFLYCENKEEALENLKKLIEFEKIDSIYCFDKELCAYTNTLNITAPNISESKFNLIKCSHLIAFDGSIMVTSHHTKGKKLNELSGSYIVYAHPSQIIENSSEALRDIRMNCNGQLPSYISSLKLNDQSFQQEKSKSKNIYLLLVEETE